MKCQSRNINSEHPQVWRRVMALFCLLGILLFSRSGQFQNLFAHESGEGDIRSSKVELIIESGRTVIPIQHRSIPIPQAMEDIDDRENKEDDVVHHGGNFSGFFGLSSVYTDIVSYPVISSFLQFGKKLPLYILFHSWKDDLTKF